MGICPQGFCTDDERPPLLRPASDSAMDAAVFIPADDGVGYISFAEKSSTQIHHAHSGDEEDARTTEQAGLLIDAEGRQASCCEPFHRRLYMKSLLKTSLLPLILASGATVMCILNEKEQIGFVLNQQSLGVLPSLRLFLPSSLADLNLGNLRMMANGQLSGFSIGVWDRIHLVGAYAAAVLPMITETMKHCYRIHHHDLQEEVDADAHRRCLRIKKSIGITTVALAGTVYLIWNYDWLYKLLTHYNTKVIEYCSVERAVELFQDLASKNMTIGMIKQGIIEPCTLDALQHPLDLLQKPWAYCTAVHKTLGVYESIAFSAPIIALIINVLYWIFWL